MNSPFLFVRTSPRMRIHARIGVVFPCTLLALALGVFALAQLARAHATGASGPAELEIGGAVDTPFAVSLADLKQMPRKTLRVENARDHKTDVYEGVALDALLQKAGLPHGEQLGGAWMTAYILVEAADNYRVVFSIAELDSSFEDSEVLVADTLNGAPFGSGQGPLKLIVPHEKRPGRWVKMLKSIAVVRPSNYAN
jgi:DMSO/TMAO reductase YedYZ molybdopterin-dependent catalytic subunit